MTSGADPAQRSARRLILVRHGHPVRGTEEALTALGREQARLTAERQSAGQRVNRIDGTTWSGVARRLPEVVRRTPRRRAAFLESFLRTLIARDVSELAAIERRGDLRRLLALLAGRSGGPLVPSGLATQSGIPCTTLGRYLELLSECS